MKSSFSEKLYKNFKDKRILVTGHTGFKGAWMVQILLNLECKILGVSKKIETKPSLFNILNHKKKINHKIIDLAENYNLAKKTIVKFNPQIIFHFAAQSLVLTGYNDQYKTFKNNILSTLNILEISKEIKSLKSFVHISSDKVYSQKKITNKISSTAEHALALTLASLRNITMSNKSVLNGEWDYTKFIGNQMNQLTIGIIGYGRLGKKYANYCKSLSNNVFFFDPYIKTRSKKIEKIKSINKLLSISDVISVHVHLDKKTYHMISKSFFLKLKKNVIIVNTSRGDIVNESELIQFLKKNKRAKYATDVLENEILKKKNKKLINFIKKNQDQVLITPHIGGMTVEAQEIAYNFIAKKLKGFFLKR